MAYLSWIWIDTIYFLACIVVILYVCVRYHYNYWKRRGIYSPGASFPGGHLGGALTGKIQMGVQLSNLYRENKQHPFIGLFLLHSKALMINDLDLIKNIMMKDFQYFPDHGFEISQENDPLFKHLFTMEGTEWKAFREKLTPTFTSSKMKYMFDIMLKCSQELEKYLEEQVMAGNEVDFKEALAKYSTDVIGSCAFGIETDSFKYPDAKFRRMGKKIIAPDLFKAIREVLSLFAPSIMRAFKLKILQDDVEEFFIKTVKETIKYREENNITRNDFLQLLINMKKLDDNNDNVKSLSIIEISAQVLLFFIAGFETTSTAASYALLELAKNPDIQTKLRSNIIEITAKYNGKITYESIREMNYLTHVIEETLRMYPPLPFLFRRCAKNYQIPNSRVVIEKGTLVLIPILGIHRDPAIHEEPLKFRPERFFPDNKMKTHPMASIPFGEGPRICIGNRFGMMQTRLGLISTLSKYEVSPCENSSLDLNTFDPKSFVLSPMGDRFLRLTRIN